MPEQYGSFFEKKHLIALLIIAFLFIYLVADGRPMDMRSHGARLLDKTYDVSAVEVRKMDGEVTTLGALIDRPTIVLFWATWCGVCAREMPEINEFFNQYGDQVNIIAVSTAGDKDSEINKFIRRYNGQDLLIVKPFDHKMHKDLELPGVPSYLITRDDAVMVAKARPKFSKGADVVQMVKTTFNYFEESKTTQIQ